MTRRLSGDRLRDAGSRNGVGVAVRGEVGLKHGSRMLVGDKLFRVVTQ